MRQELWKDIVGYEGMYQVSDMGRVRRIMGYQCLMDRIIKLKFSTRGGYTQVRLTKDNVRKERLVKHLVLDHFCGLRPTPKHEAQHLNCNPKDPRLTNLRWGIPSDRIYKSGIPNAGRLTRSSVESIRDLNRQGLSRRRLAEIFNVCLSTIYLIVNNETWRNIND